MNHDIGHSYEVAEGRFARDCSCGYFAMGKDAQEVEVLMQDHLPSQLPLNVQTSLRFLGSCGYDTSEFVERWSEPQRVYHDLGHIDEMLGSLYEIERWQANVKPNGVPFHELERVLLHLAAWYHDIVYVPGAEDNEERSGALAYHDLAGRSVSTACWVQDAVIATKTHLSSGGNLFVGYLLDADLRSLGRSLDEYRQGSKRVKAEYPGITDEQWFAGRGAFLENFLRREKIFHTGWGKQFEDRARKNMESELRYVRRRQGLVD